MTDSPENPGKAAGPPASGAVRSPGRRRLLQAGASAPVIMTVVSRPVLAVQCDSPSGFTSLNVSHPGPGACSGQTTTAVKNWLNAQPPAVKDAKFNSIFKVDNFGKKLKDKKLKDVMAHNTDAPWGLAQQILTAYFNVENGYIPPTVLTKVAIINIWNDYDKNGTYSPRVAATWNYNQIVAYLQTTIA